MLSWAVLQHGKSESVIENLCCGEALLGTKQTYNPSFLRNANFSSVLPRNLFMMSDLSWAKMITD